VARSGYKWVSDGAWKRSGVFLVAMPVAVFLVWWFVLHPDFTGRYRLAITVDANGRTLTGATVYDVTYVWDPQILPEQASLRKRVTGEALFLDLGGGRNLVVTLTARGSGRPSKPGGPNIKPGNIEELSSALSPAELPTFAFKLRLATWKTLWDIHAAWRKGKVEVPAAGLPTTVTFTDLADPKSVKLVDPTDLAPTFGPGYRITRTTIEVTDEPLSTGIEKKLPWLAELFKKRARLNGSNSIGIFTNELSDRLGSGDFKIGNW